METKDICIFAVLRGDTVYIYVYIDEPPGGSLSNNKPFQTLSSRNIHGKCLRHFCCSDNRCSTNICEHSMQ